MTKKGFSLIELVIVLTVLLILGLGSYIWWQNRSTELPKPESSRFSQLLQKDLLQGPTRSLDTPLAPKIEFNEYVLAKNVKPPALPGKIRVYTFETKLDTKQAAKTAQKLGLKLDPELTNQDELVFINFDTPEKLGYWISNPVTGEFEFQSFGVRRSSSLGANAAPSQLAEAFLREMGIWDETLRVTTTYQHEGLPFTFVEIHRSWDKIGLPILNSVGLLNLSPEIRVDQLKPGQSASNLPADGSIINSSDKADGKSRPNDFNTLTVVVTEDGRVQAISSNLRPLAQSQQTLTSAQLKTPEEALGELQQGQALYGITLLAGEGATDFNQVYPNNKASAKTATITDFTLAYLEKPASVPQKYLQPVYIFRGRAKLESGYTVNWTQTVPAIKEVNSRSKLSWTNWLRLKLAKTSALASNSDFMHITGLGDFSVCKPNAYYICFRANTQEGQSLSVGQVRDILYFDLVRKQYNINLAQLAMEHEEVMSRLKAIHSVEAMLEYFKELNGVTSYNQCPQLYKARYGGFASDAPLVMPATQPSLMCWHWYDPTRLNKTARMVAQDIIDITSTQQHPPTPEKSSPTAWFSIQEKQCEVGPWYQSWQSLHGETAYPGTADELTALIKNYYQQLNILAARRQRISSEISCLTCGCPSENYLQILLPQPDWGKAQSLGFVQSGEITPGISVTQPPFPNTSNALTELAKKPDLFPAKIVAAFGWALMTNNWTQDSAIVGEGRKRVSGESPYLYFYQDGQQLDPQAKGISVDLPSTASYRELSSNPIYYEYDSSKVNLTESETGWVVARGELDQWVTGVLAPQMNLTNQETHDLKTDLHKALVKYLVLNQPYLKVSIVDRAELNQQLPLSISPAPDQVYRIHLMLTPLEEYQELPAPQITPIDRSGFTVVELGVTSRSK